MFMVNRIYYSVQKFIYSTLQIIGIMSFIDIDFGKSAAEDEPEELLMGGFWDSYRYIDQVVDGDKFLILGSKGSGKSAIGRRIELLADQNRDFHARRYNLGDIPYNLFSSLIKNKESLLLKYQNDWEYLLLVIILNSFTQDDDFIKNNPDAKNLIEHLKNNGILSTNNLTQIVQNSANSSLEIKKYLFVSKASKIDKAPFSIPMIYESLKEICYSAIITSKHITIIDGLDDVLVGSDKQFSLLGSLILVVDRINNRFKDRRLNVKVVVLCRTDLFNRFPGSNNNKIKQDSTILLNWYKESDIKDSNLINLINLRAKFSLEEEVDVFEDMLPKTITTYNKDTMNYLFNYTRHTPRDLIALLNKIKEATKGENPTENEIWAGINNYSTEYFYTEIRDELNGFLTEEEVDKALKILTMMRTTKYMRQDIEDKFKMMKGFMMLDFDKILNQLFECNAIGNIDKNEYRSFNYRNTPSFLMDDEHILVHKGLWKALNLKVGSYNYYKEL